MVSISSEASACIDGLMVTDCDVIGTVVEASGEGSSVSITRADVMGFDLVDAAFKADNLASVVVSDSWVRNVLAPRHVFSATGFATLTMERVVVEVVALSDAVVSTSGVL